MVTAPEQVRVLVVSGSPYIRYVVSGELSSEPDLFVVGTARTAGEIAVRRSMLRPDLVIVDLESFCDLADLQPTLEKAILPVLALCSRTREGAELAFSALEAGAADVVARSNGGIGATDFAPDLLRKVRGLARTRPRPAPGYWPSRKASEKTIARRFNSGDSVIVVSASTGGLAPLVELLAALPSNLQACLLALTSLPACYLRWFLRRISPVTAFYLRQARDGLPLKRGVAYLVAYGQQISTGPRDLLTVDFEARRKADRVSVDSTLSALATRYGSAVVGVILSGIGPDGIRGALDVLAAGGSVIVQEPSTCVVNETPKAVIDAGAATAVLPPQRILHAIDRRVAQR